MITRLLALSCTLILASCSGSGSTPGATTEDNISLDDAKVILLEEAKTYKLATAGGGSSSASVVSYRWSAQPIEDGALGACANSIENIEQRAASQLQAACTAADQCAFSFDQGVNDAGDTIFSLSVPMLQAPIGLTYELTALNTAGQTTSENFTFCLASINEPPEARPDVFTVTEGRSNDFAGGSASVHLLSNDIDDIDVTNVQLTVNTTPVKQPDLASEFILKKNGGFTYEFIGGSDNPAGQDLQDSFSYEITDGIFTSTATVTLNIVTVDKPPVAEGSIAPVSYTFGEEISLDLSSNFMDPEGAELVFVVDENTLPQSGNLTISANGVLSGVPAPGDQGDYVVSFTVSDQLSTGVAASQPLAASLDLQIVGNFAPTSTPIADIELAFGDLLSVDLMGNFSDPEDDKLTYSITITPASTFLQINPDTGLITGSLSTPGVYTVIVSAEDAFNTPVTESFEITQLQSPNSPPMLNTPVANVTATENVPMTPLRLDITDPDGDAMVFELVLPATLPTDLTFDSATGTLSGTPTLAGDYNIRIRATDSMGGTLLTDVFILTVTAVPNEPPVPGVAIGNQILNAATPIESANAGFTDADTTDTLSYTFTTVPVTANTGLSLSATGDLSGTPSFSGAVTFTITANDGTVAVDAAPFNITVLDEPQNNPPVPGTPIGNQSLSAETPIETVNAGFTDADTTDTLSYTFATSPVTANTGLSLSATGDLSGTPSFSGAVTFTISANDGTVAVDAAPFNVTVIDEPQNNPPVPGAPLGNQSLNAETPIETVNAGFTDADTTDTLTYTFTTFPVIANTGLSLSATGDLFGTPSFSGAVIFTITANDGTVAVNAESFSITVLDEPQNNPPVPGAPLGDQSLNAATPIVSVNAGFTDADATDTLTYTFTSLPVTADTGLSLSATGDLSGTPSFSGEVVFTITANDGTVAVNAAPFSITVLDEPQNNPPVPGAPLGDQSLNAATPIVSVNAGFTDADTTDTLTYAFTTFPVSADTGLSLSATGDFSGTPTFTGEIVFTITANDGTVEVDAVPFSITVLAATVNEPPMSSVTIEPPSIVLGATIAPISGGFIDTDGPSPLSYSIEPAVGTTGLSFSAEGVLTGSPTAEGTLTFIISANDGLAQTDSNPFSIVVDPNAPPIQNAPILDQIAVVNTPIMPVIGTFSDTDGIILEHSIAPPIDDTGLSFSEVTGVLMGTPTQIDTLSFVISAFDGVNTVSTAPFEIDVVAGLENLTEG